MADTRIRVQFHPPNNKSNDNKWALNTDQKIKIWIPKSLRTDGYAETLEALIEALSNLRGKPLAEAKGLIDRIKELLRKIKDDPTECDGTPSWIGWYNHVDKIEVAMENAN